MNLYRNDGLLLMCAMFCVCVSPRW